MGNLGSRIAVAECESCRHYPEYKIKGKKMATSRDTQAMLLLTYLKTTSKNLFFKKKPKKVKGTIKLSTNNLEEKY